MLPVASCVGVHARHCNLSAPAANWFTDPSRCPRGTRLTLAIGPIIVRHARFRRLGVHQGPGRGLAEHRFLPVDNALQGRADNGRKNVRRAGNRRARG